MKILTRKKQKAIVARMHFLMSAYLRHQYDDLEQVPKVISSIMDTLYDVDGIEAVRALDKFRNIAAQEAARTKKEGGEKNEDTGRKIPETV